MLHHLISVRLILLLKRLPCGYLWKTLLPYFFSERAGRFCLPRIRAYTAPTEKSDWEWFDENRDPKQQKFEDFSLAQIRRLILSRINPIWIKRGDIIDIYDRGTPGTEVFGFHNQGNFIWNGFSPENLDTFNPSCRDYWFPPPSFTINEMGCNNFWQGVLSNVVNMPLWFMLQNYHVVARHTAEKDVFFRNTTLRLHRALYVYTVQHKRRTGDRWYLLSRLAAGELCHATWVYAEKLNLTGGKAAIECAHDPTRILYDYSELF